ncbi:MAG: dTDP-glucose 4,6-dehydratase [candidate division Zixibacteria bacterium]|nr:dTDP-glucose 4,6-dehydratase [candidate division Zixibacteria bacterium]
MNKILVTGGAGFIGSNFVSYALERWREAEVVVLDKLTYAGNLANLDAVKYDPRFTFIRGDVADEGTVRRAVEGCDAVINFAAETHVDRSILFPREFVFTDVVGTFTLLEVARDVGVERFVQVSTDEVYGSIEEGAFDELAALNPSSPYSASKAGGDFLALAYAKSFELPLMVARSTNNYGPYQYPEKLIPLIITNALEDRPLPLYGDGRQVRDWLYVLDNCEALALLLERGEAGAVYNVGGDCELENVDVTRRILKVLGKPEELITYVKDRPAHDRRYALSCERIKALGWRPATPFDAGLEATVRWYVENEGWWRPLRDAAFEDYYRRQYGGR